MFCWTCRRLLVGYLESELDERTRAKVEAHLVRCSRCAAELEMIRRVGGALRSNPVEPAEPPADLWARIKSEIESSKPRVVRRSRVRVSQAVGACAAMAFAGVVGFGLLKPQVHQFPSPPFADHLGAGDTGKAPQRHGLPKTFPDEKGVKSGTRGMHLSAPAPPPMKRVERAPVPSVPRKRLAAGAKQVALYKPVKPVTEKSAGLPKPSGSIAGVRPDENVVSPELKHIRITSDITTKTATEDQSSVTVRQPAPEPATSVVSGSFGSAEERDIHIPDSTGAECKLMATGGPVGESAHTFPGTVIGGESGWQVESVVDVLNRTDGVWRVALFSYP